MGVYVREISDSDQPVVIEFGNEAKLRIAVRNGRAGVTFKQTGNILDPVTWFIGVGPNNWRAVTRNGTAQANFVVEDAGRGHFRVKVDARPDVVIDRKHKERRNP